MPGDPRPICQRPAVLQQSTGQAGVEVNRDLEVLFAAVNGLLRCVSSMSEIVADASTGGGSGGAGGVGSGSGGTGGTGTAPPLGPMMRVALAANFTFPDGFTGIAFVDASASGKTITLPPPRAGYPITLIEVGGTNSFALKNDAAATIGTVYASAVAHVMPTESAAGVQAWPTGITQVQNGTIILPASVIVSGVGLGIKVQSPDATWWEVTVSNAGVATVTGVGAPL